MPHRDDRIDDEIAFHLEQQTQKNIARGMTPEAARRAARLQFGAVEGTREAARDEVPGAAFREWWRDLRLSFRTMRRTPGFATTAVVTFALGVMASVGVFSVFEGVLLRPLPFPDADRLVHVYQLNDGVRNRVADPNFADWQSTSRSFAAMGQFTEWGAVPVAGAGEAQVARFTRVGAGFFEAFGVLPAKGRLFRADEQQPGATGVAVVSASFWRRWRGEATPSTDTLRVSGDTYTVIGVMPEGFDFPRETAIWTNRGATPPNRSRTSHNSLVVARLAPGVSVEQATTDVSTLAKQLKATYGASTWMTDAEVVPVLSAMTQASRPVIQLLFAAALLLLLVATINLSNLLVVRAAARRAEFSLQLALGATPARLTRQLFAESVAICLSGAVLGVVGAMVAVRLFVAAGPVSMPRLADVSVGWPAILFAMGVALLAAVGVTVFSSMNARSAPLAAGLADQTRGASGSRRQVRTREALIVAQVAIALVLLTASALLGRSLVKVMSVDPGFSLDDGLVVEVVSAGDGEAASLAQQVRFQDELMAQLRRQPGVAQVGLVSAFPLGVLSGRNGSFIEMTRPDEITTFEGFDSSAPTFKDRKGSSEYRHVSGDYFGALGIPLLEGRLITDADTPNSPHVAVVSQSLAQRQWPGRSALGRWIQFGNMDGDLRAIQVVGVVGDVREVSPESTVKPMLYVSARQRPLQAGRAWVVVKGPAALTLGDTARKIVRDLDPEVPVTLTTMQGALDQVLSARRFTLWLVGAFGLAAFLLAASGVYGLMSFVVGQSAREMGIRLALGATPGGLVRLIVSRGVALALTGAGAGLAVGLLAVEALDGLLFGVTPTDPLTLAASSLLVSASAILASYLPARRLLRTSPASALRHG